MPLLLLENMKRLKKTDYVSPQAEALLIHTPLSLLVGMSAESDLMGEYEDSGELKDAVSIDDAMGW